MLFMSMHSLKCHPSPHPNPLWGQARRTSGELGWGDGQHFRLVNAWCPHDNPLVMSVPGMEIKSYSKANQWGWKAVSGRINSFNWLSPGCLFCLFYKHTGTNNKVFNDFSMISDHFLKISEYDPKMFQLNIDKFWLIQHWNMGNLSANVTSSISVNMWKIS